MHQTYIVRFTELKQLKKYYMPFIQNGGIFIRTTNEHLLKQAVDLHLHLMNSEESFKVLATVVWISPPLAQYGFEQGIGVQIDSRDGWILTKQIETLLKQIPESNFKTATL